jgi:N-acetylmuramoyl-L-alanine amidase
MKYKHRKILSGVIVAIFVLITFFTPLKMAGAFSNQIIQRGAVGDDVIELQARLQYNGYYHGTIDGVYGWSTYWAVRNFQHAFGLEEVDGLVGPKTKRKLIRATKFNKPFVYEQLRKGNDFTHYGGVPWSIQVAPSEATKAKFRKRAEAIRAKQEKEYQVQKRQQPQQQAQRQQPQQQQPQPQRKEQTQQRQQQQQQKRQQQQQQQKRQQQGATATHMPNGFSQNDIQLMANAVYGEARGEPYIGKVAVAAVILNRLNSSSFPNTVAGVIFEPGAFTAVADGQIWLTPDEEAKKAVLDAINGWDPSDNALYYFNPNTATSGWIWTRPQIKQIGKHIFTK